MSFHPCHKSIRSLISPRVIWTTITVNGATLVVSALVIEDSLMLCGHWMASVGFRCEYELQPLTRAARNMQILWSNLFFNFPCPLVQLLIQISFHSLVYAPWLLMFRKCRRSMQSYSQIIPHTTQPRLLMRWSRINLLRLRQMLLQLRRGGWVGVVGSVPWSLDSIHLGQLLAHVK